MNLCCLRGATLGLAVAASLAGCFSAPSRNDSNIGSSLPPVPTTPPPIPDSVPNAMPRVEPRARNGNPPFYDVFGKRYFVLSSSVGYVERGVASWYGPGFHKVRTSTGEMYDMYGMTAAHKTLPLPAYVQVTNLQNGRSIVVRVNDRGPFVGNRIIDLSYTAAAKLDMLRNGTAIVEVRTIDPSQGGIVTASAVAPSGVVAAAAAVAGSSVPAAMAATGTAAGASAPPVNVAGNPSGVSVAAAGTPAGASTSTAAPAAIASAAAPTAASASTTVAAPAPGTAAAASPAGLAGAPPSTEVTTTVPVNSASLFIQAGAFSDPANAERLADKLRSGSYGKVFVRDDRIAGRRMYRVRIGPVPDVAHFDRIVAALERIGISDAHLALD